MSAIDFRKHVIFQPDGEPMQDAGLWRVENQGRQVRTKDSNYSIFVG